MIKKLIHVDDDGRHYYGHDLTRIFWILVIGVMWITFTLIGVYEMERDAARAEAEAWINIHRVRR